MTYICTHTDFNEYVKEGNFKIMATKKLNGSYSFPVLVADNDINPMAFAYSEGISIRDVYLKTTDEWVGINHYRRYFNGKQTDETTLPIPLQCNMHRQFATYHNINDLYKVEAIIDKYYPEYSMKYDDINVLYTNNMFIMNRHDFNKYCEFVFGVLDKFNEENNLHSDADVEKYVIANQSQYRNIINVKYQSRLHGFLMERIGTIFFLTYFKNKQVTYKKIDVVSEKIKTY